MDLIGRAARLFGSAPALRTPAGTLSFSEFDAAARRIASRLKALGADPGDCVAILSANSPEMLLLLAALLKGGMVAAPLNHRFPPQLQRSTLEKLSPRLVVIDGGEPMLMPGIKTVTFGTLFAATEAVEAAETLQAPEAMDRPVTVIHTSASSGEAKAVLHSFANHWYSALGANENLPFGPAECWLLSLPLYHIGGYSLLFRALVSGGCIAVGHQEESIALSLQHFPLTHLSLVPTQLYRLLADPSGRSGLGGLNALLLGGSGVPKSLMERALRHNIPIYLTYGSTEMASQIATTPGPISGFRQESGRVLPYRQIRTAEDGELLVRGECLFQGYLRRGTVQSPTDSEGWFHTSDIGRVDHNGMVTVLGRKDNMFISGGENLHPEEIEKALMMIDGVREALVVPLEEQEYGQRPLAFILAEEGENPDEGAIRLEMHALVGKLKSPVRCCRVDRWTTLPGSQKIDRAWYRRAAVEDRENLLS